jgi:hypothetical protein
VVWGNFPRRRESQGEGREPWEGSPKAAAVVDRTLLGGQFFRRRDRTASVKTVIVPRACREIERRGEMYHRGERRGE